MSDERQILGVWHIKLKKWKWEYVFFDTGTVLWSDVNSRESGSGRWVKAGQFINVTWTGSTTRESWQCPIDRGSQRVLFHTSYFNGWVDAESIDKFEPGALDYDYDVGYVPIFRGDGADCWAAGAAMMVTWHSRNYGISIPQVLETMGPPFPALFQLHQGLRLELYQDWFTNNPDEKVRHLTFTLADMERHYARAAGMQYEPMRSYTPGQLYELLARCRSPLLVQTYWSDPWTHMNVIRRIYGSGIPDNTLIEYNDPRSRKKQQLSFKEFAPKLEAAAAQINLQIMHY